MEENTKGVADKVRTPKILVTGACGQLGSELTEQLNKIYGVENVVISDLKEPVKKTTNHFEALDVTDTNRLYEIIESLEITQIYHLAAILSAKGEENPHIAWRINMDGLLNVLEAGRRWKLDKIYWPSSIAVFGVNSPKNPTPQNTVIEPSTAYGISKHAGELWCQYYHDQFGLDVRSLRYPGLIGYQGLPGGGTTDYAVDIFHKAVQGEKFTCFLSKDTVLPMMYMPDAIKATLDLMEADKEKLSVHTSYNIQAISFSPEEIFNEIKKSYPSFTTEYAPDFRQKIADSWPEVIDDAQARNDWNWEPNYDLKSMVADMLKNLKEIKDLALVQNH